MAIPPGELEVLTNWWIIGIALALLVIEFFADKIPYLDTVWDAIHTFIRVPAGAVSGNTANNNGNDGICSLQGTNVIGNTVDNNTGFGLNLANAVGYSGNVVWNNTAGTVLNGTAAGNNVCNGTTTCP